jgi:hypothetical protein
LFERSSSFTLHSSDLLHAFGLNSATNAISFNIIIQGYSKRSIHFQKFILQKLLMLNPCPVYGWKGNLSKFWYWWSEVVHHRGCGCCYLWNAMTSVGRAGLSI